MLQNVRKDIARFVKFEVHKIEMIGVHVHLHHFIMRPVSIYRTWIAGVFAVCSLSAETRLYVWEKRQHLLDVPRALPRVLQAVSSWSPRALPDIYNLIQSWSALPPTDALELLLPW